MNKLNYILLFIILLLLLFSCSSQKNITQNKQPRQKSISTKKLIKQTKKQYLNYNTLNYKASTKIYFNKKKYPLKANFRIKHDSIIWIYLAHSSGYPVATMLLTQDSVKLINKIEKEYFLDTYNYFNKNFNLKLNYKNIQSLITDEFFVFSDSIDISKLKFKQKAKADTNYYTFSTLKKHKLNKRMRKYRKNKLKYNLINQTFVVNALTKKIEKVIIENITEKQKISIKYNNFVTIGEQTFPKKIFLNYTDKNDSLNINIKIKLSKININKKLKYKFKIPKSYKKIDE